MAASRNPFRRFRLVYRRSSPLLKCVVLAAIILSTIALLTLRIAIRDAKIAQAELRSKAAAIKQENDNLSRDIDKLGTVESVKELAGKLLGLVDPDSVIFLPEQ